MTTRNIQLLKGGGIFSGFRHCNNCGKAKWFDPRDFPYDDPLYCTNCPQSKLIPLLDSEVLYYLQKIWKMQKLARDIATEFII
jgi:hypothetical protein